MKVQQIYRYDKLFSDTIYVLNKNVDNNTLIFDISGSTKNIYKVKIYPISKMIFCNCPDSKSHTKKLGVICKHSCFVLFKVLKLFSNIEDIDSINYFQRLYFTDEQFNTIKINFNNINISLSSDIVNLEYTQKYQELIKNNIHNTDNNTITPRINCDMYCSICYDDYTKNELTNYDINRQCAICKTIFHKKCLYKWFETNKSCPYCRSKIVDDNNRYLNLFQM